MLRYMDRFKHRSNTHLLFELRVRCKKNCSPSRNAIEYAGVVNIAPVSTKQLIWRTQESNYSLGPMTFTEYGISLSSFSIIVDGTLTSGIFSSETFAVLVLPAQILVEFINNANMEFHQAEASFYHHQFYFIFIYFASLFTHKSI